MTTLAKQSREFNRKHKKTPRLRSLFSNKENYFRFFFAVFLAAFFFGAAFFFATFFFFTMEKKLSDICFYNYFYIEIISNIYFRVKNIAIYQGKFQNAD